MTEICEKRELAMSFSPNYILLSSSSSQAVREILAKKQETEALFPEYWQMKRYEEIDKMLVTTKDGVELKAAEVAAHNKAEIAQVTQMRWFGCLSELFSLADIRKMPCRTEEGRLKIGVAGCEDGQGIAGLLAFFNSRETAVDIFGVDPRGVGEVDRYKEQLSFRASTVTLAQGDIVDIFQRDWQFDLVVFPNPGPFADWKRYNAWKKIVETMVKTEPSLIIFSFPRTGWSVRDLLVLADVWKTEEMMDLREEQLFEILLKKSGYFRGALRFFNDVLKIPYYLYGAEEIVGEEKEFLSICDPYFSLFIHRDTLPVIR
ncbi:MAG: hypothetical protein M1514_00970 [Patescibacteria group bacterium]|nr:hypothetical protein [Patescibacteria group bacterium]